MIGTAKHVTPENLAPDFPWPRPSTPGIELFLALVGLIAALVGLYYLGETSVPWAIRVLLPAGLALASVSYWLLPVLSRVFRTAQQRIVWYRALHQQMEAAHREAQDLSAKGDALANVVQLEQHRLRVVTYFLSKTWDLLSPHRIIGLIKTAEDAEPLLVLAPTKNRTLQTGDRLLVVDENSFEQLAVFEVVGKATTGYRAKSLAIWDSLWWGHMHDCANRRETPATSAVAVVIPGTDDLMGARS